MERCRICLDTNNLSNIFETAEVAQNITAIACVDVLKNDGLPQYICILCKHELDISVNFKDKCESTFKILKEQYSKVQIKENILFNILSEGNRIETRDCTINCVETKGHNGDILESNEKNHEVDTETSISMFKDCHNRNQMEIVESTEDVDISDIECYLPDDQLSELPEIDIDFIINSSSCQKCNFYFANNESLIQHLNRIHPKTMTQCQVCSMHFPNSHLSKEHMRQIHNDNNEFNENNSVFRCKVCNIGFKQQSALNTHLCLPSTQKDLKCDMCSSSYKDRKQLDNHIKTTHSGIEYLCEYCNEKFCQSDVFQKHLLHHRNDVDMAKVLRQNVKDNKLTCLTSNRKNSNNSDLMVNNKIHKGNKPHVCSICHVSFYKRNGLERHLLEHDDLITCTKDETYVFDYDGDD